MRDNDPVLEIVRGIYRDLTNVDDEMKAEMVTAWYAIINRHFRRTTLLAPMDILREAERA